MTKIHSVIVNESEVFLKHDFTGWRVVRPFKNDLSKPIVSFSPFKINWKNINWKNLIAGGSWIKLIAVMVVVVTILGAMFEYYSHLILLTKCLTALNDTVILIP